MRQLKTIIFLLFFVQIIHGQSRVVSGLNIMHGKGVDFVFKSLSDIKNGKSLVSFTEIYIYFDTIGSPVDVDGDPATGWELVAYTTDGNLEPAYGSTPMLLDEILLTVNQSAGTSTIYAPAVLTNNPANVIASGFIGDGVIRGGGEEWTLTLDYDCGVPAGLSIYPADYYYTNLTFELRPVY